MENVDFIKLKENLAEAERVCGSADHLATLGVNIESGPEQVQATINTIGIGFLLHPCFILR